MTRTPLRAVIFDLDGTLADTPAAERAAWPRLASVIASHIPGLDLGELEARYRQAFEPHWTAYLEGRIDFGDYRRRRLGDAVAPWGEVSDACFEEYRAEKRRVIDEIRAYADAVPTLRLLRARGISVALLTNGGSAMQRRKLEVTGLARELDAVAVSEELGVAKPDAAAFHAAAGLAGCDPAEAAMVGDSPLYDVEGARAAGLARAVLVTRGLALQAGDAEIVESLADLPAAFGLA